MKNTKIGIPYCALFYLILFLNSQVATAQEQKTILFYGTSLTAGYGLNPKNAYPGLIMQKIEKEGHEYNVVNESLSGETTTGGLRRIDKVLSDHDPDIFVVELGANDGLRRVSARQIQGNLEAILEKVKSVHPQAEIVIAGMKLPPNLGREYVRSFENIFPRLAQKYNATLIPFLLEEVGGEPNLNLPDGIHPNIEGQKIIAETVWEILKPIL
jgi:acyl-CoA thioesterase I